jgi:hypothetical protein
LIAARARLLIGLAAFFALVLALEWLVPAGSAIPATAQGVHLVTAARPSAPPLRKTADWAATILARPLFSISRRPPRVVARGPAETAVGEARLSGIMISRYGRHAIFAPDGGGKPLVLAEGASVNDSTIRSIQADRVVLASGAVLHPTYDRNRSTLTTTPPFQPAMMPNFGQPGFNNPAFPPNFQTPGFPPPAFQPPAFVPGEGNPGVLPNSPQNPMFRGAMMPQRR